MKKLFIKFIKLLGFEIIDQNNFCSPTLNKKTKYSINRNDGSKVKFDTNAAVLITNQNEPIGRRLDFLMQELNREANTLSSKATATSTTMHAVELKVLVEQMREQIQNIE